MAASRSPARTVSLAAERAVRLLRGNETSLDSVRLIRAVLATRAGDEGTATRLLRVAFAGDPRLAYRDGGWTLARDRSARPRRDPDRVLVFADGRRARPGVPYRLERVAVVRLREDQVVSACGGDATEGRSANRLRRQVLRSLEGAIAVIHDAPGAIGALERWLGEPLVRSISLRQLARRRLGLAGHHDLRALAAKLGLRWLDSDDPLDLADALDACLLALRRPGESLTRLQEEQCRRTGEPDWSRFAFDREFLREIPAVPGTYRFYDAAGCLLYVGKSKNLQRRVNSYFYGGPGPTPPRLRRLLERLHRIEIEPAGSDLEAMLREAEQIRRRQPSGNVQRSVRARTGRAVRLRSILILEPAERPAVLRAYLIRDGRLLARVPIGVRGGGLKRIERLLERSYFSGPSRAPSGRGPDLDVEVVARWLATNRDRAVAFDPTDLGSSGEVIERLRWFLVQGSPFDSDGGPVFRR